MTADAEIRIASLERRLSSGNQLLQVLLGIRLRSVTDPECRRHLTWLSDVVAAMGLLNRRTTDQGPVDFAAYLEDAAAFWRRACEDRGIRIDVRAAPALLPESHGLPLAIVLHELMSNAVRHAFPGERRGSIAVAYSLASDGVSLVVRDSGVGASSLATSDGLLLVEGLVQHLGGVMSIETAAEACVGVRVRLPLGDTVFH
jgi:two-component sensor histidine kinase